MACIMFYKGVNFFAWRSRLRQILRQNNLDTKMVSFNLSSIAVAMFLTSSVCDILLFLLADSKFAATSTTSAMLSLLFYSIFIYATSQCNRLYKEKYDELTDMDMK
jgi:uncharacterized membrane protein